jgi:NAD(P)-dependent dehydrogenase (short-subunit alcohol dehydrogenase family)
MLDRYPGIKIIIPMRKVALITGGSRGIGYSIARHLAGRDFDIAINGVRPESSVEDSIRTIKQSGVDVIYCRGDISLPEDRNEILDKVEKHYGRIDVLVNNAGIPPKERRDILSATEESFDRVISVNLKGTYFLTQAVANRMISLKKSDPDFKGCIINISSTSASVASVNRGEYCISKAGLSMITSLFAVRLGEFDIPVYEIRPGIISTDMTTGVKEKYDRMIKEGICLQKRWGVPDDIGKMAAALAEGSFPYSTGQVFVADGGMTTQRL